MDKDVWSWHFPMILWSSCFMWAQHSFAHPNSPSQKAQFSLGMSSPSQQNPKPWQRTTRPYMLFLTLISHYFHSHSHWLSQGCLGAPEIWRACFGLNRFCICCFFSLDCVSSSIHMAHSLTLLEYCPLMRVSWLLRPSYYSKYSHFYPSFLHYFSPSFSLSPFFPQSNILHISLICLLYSQFLP